MLPLKPVAIRVAKNKEGRNSGKGSPTSVPTSIDDDDDAFYVHNAFCTDIVRFLKTLSNSNTNLRCIHFDKKNALLFFR